MVPWSLMRTTSVMTCVLDLVPTGADLDRIQDELKRRQQLQRGGAPKKEKAARREGNPKKRA
jgi:chorismate synthase